jgi:hypothetical protein
MKSLFRSIRHKLLNEGKLLRYLSYAVGEVVLIIVGILMALKINDWNADRKAQVEFESYLVFLEQDIERTIALAERRAERAGIRAQECVTILKGIESYGEGGEPDEAFERLLSELGRYYLADVFIGRVSDLLAGDVDKLSRDQELSNRAREMSASIRTSLAYIEEKIRDLDTLRSIFNRYRASVREAAPDVSIQYDLQRLSESEFTYATQNSMEVFFGISDHYGRITRSLAEFQSILEEIKEGEEI